MCTSDRSDQRLNKAIIAAHDARQRVGELEHLLERLQKHFLADARDALSLDPPRVHIALERIEDATHEIRKEI